MHQYVCLLLLSTMHPQGCRICITWHTESIGCNFRSMYLCCFEELLMHLFVVPSRGSRVAQNPVGWSRKRALLRPMWWVISGSHYVFFCVCMLCASFVLDLWDHTKHPIALLLPESILVHCILWCNVLIWCHYQSYHGRTLQWNIAQYIFSYKCNTQFCRKQFVVPQY